MGYRHPGAGLRPLTSSSAPGSRSIIVGNAGGGGTMAHLVSRVSFRSAFEEGQWPRASQQTRVH